MTPRARHVRLSNYEAGGTEGAAQTGEEYRQELRRVLERLGDRSERLPWRVGSGMARRDRTGYFFCATVGDRVYLRFVPLAPDEEIISEIGTCLRLIECTEDTPAALSADMAAAAFDAWQRARASIFEAWTFKTDPANLQPKVRRLNHEVAEFLRKYPPPISTRIASSAVWMRSRPHGRGGRRISFAWPGTGSSPTRPSGPVSSWRRLSESAPSSSKPRNPSRRSSATSST